MKMEKPMVEAVRFNSADVIATSGGGAPYDAFPLSTRDGSNGYYTGLRSEVEDAGLPYTNNNSSHEFVFFKYDAESNTFPLLTTFDYMYAQDYYAWFHNGQWWTENKTVGQYGLNPKSTEGWRKD